MKSESTHRSLSTQILMGAAAIGLGLLFLLDNLDIFDFRHAIHFWPTVVILVGLLKLWDARTAGGYLVGTTITAIGLVMLLNRLDYIDVDMGTLWPLLLIGLGGFVIWKAATRRNGVPAAGPAPGESNDTVDITAVLGGFERRITTQDFRGGEVTAIMGGCDLDMRDASIRGEAVLNVFAVFGGIEIKVPRDWTVILHGTPIMGGFDEKTNPPLDASKRLVVKGHAIMGGVEVRN